MAPFRPIGHSHCGCTDTVSARAEAQAAARRAARKESFNGINGITGIIGRQPTTQPRRTVHELLVRKPQGWKELEPIEAQMAAPNDGTFFVEPKVVESEGEPKVDEGE